MKGSKKGNRIMLPLDEPLSATPPSLDWRTLVGRARDLASESLPESEEDANDVAQDAVLKLLLLEQPPRSIEAWLRIVVARGVARVRSDLELEQCATSDPAWPTPRPGTTPEERVFARQILAHFPASERRLLLLHADGSSNRELARDVHRRRVVITRRLEVVLAEARRFAGAGSA